MSVSPDPRARAGSPGAPKEPKQIDAEIREVFGGLPLFLDPEVVGRGRDAIWRLMRDLCFPSELPKLLKNLALARAAQFCSVPYLVIRQACALSELGVGPGEILELLSDDFPRRGDELQRALGEAGGTGPGSLRGILAAIARAYSAGPLDEDLTLAWATLERTLGDGLCEDMRVLIACARAVGWWVESNPSLGSRVDPGYASTFSALVSKEPRLSGIFETQTDRARLLDDSAEKAMRSLRQVSARKIGETEKLASAVAEAARMATWELDPPTGRFSPSPLLVELIAQPGLRPASGVASFESFLALIHPSDREFVESTIRSAAERRHPFQTDLRIRRGDGEHGWYELRGEPRGSAGLAGSIQDIDERKRSEAMIQHQQARIVSAARLSALGEMAAGIAHEVNNPLTVIHSAAQTLAALPGLESGKQRELVDRIESTCLRIARIVRGLRALSRDSADVPLEPATLRKIVDDAIELCEQKSKGRGIRVETDLPEGEVEITCRQVQVAQVILNLLNNAIAAVEKLEEKWIRVEAQDLGEGIEIRVIDSGPGIAPEVREKVFEPFFTTKAVGTGTGLGLSICRGIVERHGGSIFVDPDRPNTCFSVQLPKAPPE